MIGANSFAAGVGASTRNTAFSPATQVVPRKILIFATIDPTKESSVDLNQPQRVLSANDCGSKFGFGFMAHRLAMKLIPASQGLPVYVIPQAEAGGAAAASADIEFAVDTLKAGTLYLYIAYQLVQVNLTAGLTNAQVAEAVAAAINADSTLPVTAVQGSEAEDDTVTVTSKSKGLFGNEISLALNADGEETPDGLTVTVGTMTGGTGVPSITTALQNLGENDDANEDFYTGAVHGYLQDPTTLNSFSQYIGEGDTAQGTWAKLTHKPFRVLTGDVAAGSGGLSALVSLANGRKLDRGNGVIAVPGSLSHPSEIAAVAMGKIELISHTAPAQNYVNAVLDGVHTGDKTDRWTSNYADRDSAIRGGISATKVVGGKVLLQNVMTFYRPDNVAEDSNGYRSMRSIAILQNILFNVALNFSGPRWDGFFVVQDTAQVTDPAAKAKARDRDSVLNDLVSIAGNFQGFGWLYSATFTVERLASDENLVTIRNNGTGFDINLPIILSGEGGILDSVIEFDTSLAIAL